MTNSPSPPQPLTFLDALRLAKGCHDYSGGYGGTPCNEAFHAGISTVVNVLTQAASGQWDYQLQAVFDEGARPSPSITERARAAPQSQPSADGETGELVAWLLDKAEQAANSDSPVAAGMLTWAAQVAGEHADLLEQLAQPAVEPTDEELNELFVQFDPTGQAECWRGYARAVLARWGRPSPQPIPVSERLPEAGDCDAEGRCWFNAYDHNWLLEDRTYGSNAARSYWLPANALPLPAAEVK